MTVPANGQAINESSPLIMPRQPVAAESEELDDGYLLDGGHETSDRRVSDRSESHWYLFLLTLSIGG